jgi:predicted glycosyltransferase involved in capsule biosynthesis
MDRLSFLEQALPTWCALSEIDEIIIVDWGMKEDLQSLIKGVNDDRICVLHVPNKIHFDAGAAHNLGIRYANEGYVFVIDCDIIVNKSPFLLIDINSNNKFYNINDVKSLAGTCIFKKYMWEKVNGYVEGLLGWGGEDDNFYDRLIKKEFQKVNISSDYLTHIHHDDKLRIKNMVLKGSPKETANMNEERLKTLNVQTQIHSKYLCHIVNKNSILKNQLI